MASHIDSDSLFSVSAICVYSGICRCKIHFHTDRSRRGNRDDLFCNGAYSSLRVYDSFRKILLWIRVCIRKSGRWNSCIYLWCFKKRKKSRCYFRKITEKLSYLKYLVLTVIAVLCFAGVYGKARGTSPWDVFSMLHAGNFHLQGYLPGVILLIFIIVGMCLEERFFCRNLCPMGAVFSLLPVLPFFALHRDRENCIKGCSGCTKKCPSGIGLPEDGSIKVEGDCFQCQKCIDTCPKKHIHTGIKGLKGNEFWFTILRAILLLVIMIWAGV